METIIQAEFNTKYETQKKLYTEMKKLAEKYSNQISVAQFIGVIEIVKFEIMQD
jgi:hypothetical protein